MRGHECPPPPPCVPQPEPWGRDIRALRQSGDVACTGARERGLKYIQFEVGEVPGGLVHHPVVEAERMGQSKNTNYWMVTPLELTSARIALDASGAELVRVLLRGSASGSVHRRCESVAGAAPAGVREARPRVAPGRFPAAALAGRTGVLADAVSAAPEECARPCSSRPRRLRGALSSGSRVGRRWPVVLLAPPRRLHTAPFLPLEGVLCVASRPPCQHPVDASAHGRHSPPVRPEFSRPRRVVLRAIRHPCSQPRSVGIRSPGVNPHEWRNQQP